MPACGCPCEEYHIKIGVADAGDGILIPVFSLKKTVLKVQRLKYKLILIRKVFRKYD